VRGGRRAVATLLQTEALSRQASRLRTWTLSSPLDSTEPAAVVGVDVRTGGVGAVVREAALRAASEFFGFETTIESSAILASATAPPASRRRQEPDA
jgi:hypothetical protein